MTKPPYKVIIFDYDGVMTTRFADLRQFPRYSVRKSLLGLLFNRDMTELTAALKKRGYRIVLLSNTIKPLAFIRKRKKYYDLFDDVFLSYETGFRKPSPKAFEMVLDHCRIKPEQALFIDDRLRNVKTAERLGMDTIHARNFLQLKAELIAKLALGG